MAKKAEVSLLLALPCCMLVLLVACSREPHSKTADSTQSAGSAVPAYLQPAFASLDTLLTPAQQDSLRVLTLDSAFRFRNYRLAEVVRPRLDEWIHSPIGDTIIAHGEQTYMTGSMVLDLYQQHLQHQPLDIAGAMRRISSAYVESVLPWKRSVDSVLLQKDLDASGETDYLVREAKSRPIGVDGGGSDSLAEADTVPYTEYRLALYLDATPLASHPPAWTAQGDTRDDVSLIRSIPLSTGGTLLVIGVGSADAYETIVVLARLGRATEVLHHQINYGEGDFAIREEGGRVVVDASEDVLLGERTIHADIQCPQSAWAAATLTYDESKQQFAVQRFLCIPRRSDG